MENKNNENVNDNVIIEEGKEVGKDANGVPHIKVVDPKKETRKKVVIGFAFGLAVAGLTGLAAYQVLKNKKGNLTEIPVQVAQAAVQAAEPVKAAAPEAVNVAQDVVNGVQVAAF